MVNPDAACRVSILGFHIMCGRAAVARDGGLDLVASVADSENSSDAMLEKPGCGFEPGCARCAAKLESAGIFFRRMVDVARRFFGGRESPHRAPKISFPRMLETAFDARSCDSRRIVQKSP